MDGQNVEYMSETNNISSIVCVTKRLFKESGKTRNSALVSEIRFKEILIAYMI
jgi:hypothetical protein